VTRTAARRLALAVIGCAAVAIGALPSTDALAAGCAARASQTWSAADQPELTVEAVADGPTCAQAVVTIAVRDGDGAVAWTQAFIAADNFVLREGSTPKTMQAALRRWLDPGQLKLGSTAELPEWAEDAPAPGGEFPFSPSEIFASREDYEALREADRPLLCLVSGNESALCLVYLVGRLDEVGIQSFPG
jgi:hypothetical protein